MQQFEALERPSRTRHDARGYRTHIGENDVADMRLLALAANAIQCT
jgi:hypothetical protein